MYLDALMVQMRQDGKVDNRAVYAAVGNNMEGQKSVLGLWVSGNKGAKYWMSVLMNLKHCAKSRRAIHWQSDPVSCAGGNDRFTW